LSVFCLSIKQKNNNKLNGVDFIGVTLVNLAKWAIL